MEERVGSEGAADEDRSPSEIDGTAAEPRAPRLHVPVDAAVCRACATEVLDPYERRYRYPLATCAECGPGFSIAEGFPFERARTSMSGYPMCPECSAEHADASDRRHHASSMACFACGPAARLERSDGRAFSVERYSMLDAVDAVASLLMQGEIVAVKGLTSYHLCCDATRADVVERLLSRLSEEAGPLPLMATDVAMIERYAKVDDDERAQLESSVAPVVLLERRASDAAKRAARPEASGSSPSSSLTSGSSPSSPLAFDGLALGPPPSGPPIRPIKPRGRHAPIRPLAEGVAPEHGPVGFQLPHTALHVLMLKRVDRPIVCTVGRLPSGLPCGDDTDAKTHLTSVVDWLLIHDREIVNPADDSMTRKMAGRMRTIHWSRGLGPSAHRLPPGLVAAPSVLACGSQAKPSVALTTDGHVVLSASATLPADADEAPAPERSLATLTELYAHRPAVIVVDSEPNDRAASWGRTKAEAERVPLIEVQRHHAHVAAVMAEHAYPADGPPVLGIAIGGLSRGDDQALWGGELMLAQYAGFVRVGTFKPVEMPGGERAEREPWRNLCAHLRAAMDDAELRMSFGDLPLVQRLLGREASELDRTEANPTASSVDRLFEAVAAAVDLCFERQAYEGHAASALEAVITPEDLAEAKAGERYPIGLPTHPELDLPYVEPRGMWAAILGDLYAETRPGLISARFHVALAEAIVRMAEATRKREDNVQTVVLGGGGWLNRHLLELTVESLERAGFRVLTPVRFPAHDGGVAIGQAAIAAARLTR